ncbi:MAG: spermine synthase [Methylococcales bacterium]
MYKYDGLLIYQSHDDDGVLEVVEEKGVRSLHFGSEPRQSSLLLSNPDKLELSYVRAMTSWQLFKPILDDEALLIGLGGGSLTKHLLKHFPDCRLKVIECRKSVVKIARSHFSLPLDPRLKIIIDDGGAYIKQRTESNAQRYSLLLVDAFDHENLAPAIANEAFFTACQSLLKKDGMLVINLWGGDDNPLYNQCSAWINHIFKQKALFLPIRDRGNVIALAFNEDAAFSSLKYLRQQAVMLEQHYQIEFPDFLKDLKRNNERAFSQLIVK